MKSGGDLIGYPWLARLESQLKTLPAGDLKFDMEPAYEAMARWIENLNVADRQALLGELPLWLSDRAHPWHSRAAIEMARRLGDEPLLTSAILAAKLRGVGDLPPPVVYPEWLAFHLALIAAIADWAGPVPDDAQAYLEEMRQGAISSTWYSRRLLGIRAWFAQCLLDEADRQPWLRQAINVLRAWDDPRLMRSLALLHAYFWNDPSTVEFLSSYLTRAEFDQVENP